MGVISVNPFFVAPGLRNNYYNLFGGTDEYATFGSTSSHKFMHGGLGTPFAWTVIFWLKFSSTPSGINAARGIFSTGTSSSANVGVDIYFSDSGVGSETLSIVYSITNASGSIVTCVSNAVFTNAVPDDTDWHHYALTYDEAPTDTNGNLYVDGALFSSTNKRGNAPSSSNSAVSPRWGCIGSAVLPIAGGIFYPKIVDRALTAAEVLEDYNLGNGDVRVASYGGDMLNAHHFPGGVADFSTWTDLIGSNNATMINQENTDITLYP